MRLILMAVLLLPATLFSQPKKDNIVFGKVSKEELLATTCEFDKDAEAVVLLDYGKMYLDLGGPQFYYSELQVHRRIKILKEDGLKNADIKLEYEHYLNSQDINNIVANTYNLDASGNVVASKLDKKLIYQKKLNTKYTQQSFTMPDVKVGSVIEYKYTFRGYISRHRVMQESIPVKLSKYEVNFPGSIELHTRTFCTYPVKAKDESTGVRTIKKYEMENIPGFTNEEYVSCKADYVQRIECWPVAYTVEGRRYPMIKTWTAVAKMLLEDEEFGMQLKKEIPRTADLDEQLKIISDPYLKMVTIHNYVRTNMKWDGVDNFWARSGVKSAWKDKSGTSGEINLILINLLRDAGLKVNPIMVSTNDNGRITMSFPDLYQFNKVLAYVAIGDTYYVLDGTDKYTQSGIIPRDVMATEGMILDPESPMSFRMQVLWDETHVDKNVVILQASIDESGKMKGHATITSRDYGRTKRTPRLKNKEEYISQFISKGKQDFAIEDLKWKNEENDSLPLIQEFDFNGAVNSSGDYSYFSINMFGGFGANPFISEQRVADVFFGTNQMHQIITSIRIPDGYVFEELPKNIKMTLEDGSLSVSRMIAVQGGMLSSRITLEFKRPFYSPEEYADLREFYKKMYSLLDEQIVFKKKS